jgi:hypothetical protein
MESSVRQTGSLRLFAARPTISSRAIALAPESPDAVDILVPQRPGASQASAVPDAPFDHVATINVGPVAEQQTDEAFHPAAHPRIRIVRRSVKKVAEPQRGWRGRPIGGLPRLIRLGPNRRDRAMALSR